MKLGTKVLLVIFLTWTFMVWATYIGSTKILEKSYLLLEDKQQARDINQIHEVINALLINNDINLKAWADWDEMYQFAVDHDKKFLDANITPASLANFYIDLFLIYDINGNPLFTQELNSDRSKFLPMPHEIAQLFNKRGILNRLVTLPESDNDVVGLVLVPSKGILGFASRRILNSEEKGPAHGTLISVQYINETVLQELRKQSKLDIYLFTLPQIQKNAELNKEFTRVLVTGKDDARVNHNEKTIFLYYILRDINHKPIGFIKTIVPRDIRIAGKNTVFYFNVALTTTGIIFAIMLFYLIRSLVIIRLEKINNKLGNIIKENNFTLRVPDEGKDELSSVGTEMNKMLSTISSVESVLTDTINSMPSMLIIIDNSIHITNLNYLAEKELGLTSEKAKGKPLFDLFPFLLMYEDKITDSIKNTLVQEIKKISYTTDKNSRFLNVIIFPLHQSREKTIAIRIDDISERIKLEERLMQTDKLTSVGILTTGVASEIDEPIHYIYNSVEPIKKNMDMMLSLLQKYKKLGDDENFSPQLQTIEKSKSNLPHIIKDTNQIIQKTLDYTNFTTKIIQELQVFSRLDENVLKKTNLYEGIDSALLLLRHHYKDKIEIIKNYEKIAEIECFPGKINQVFINIILNAIDAIPKQGKIIISGNQTNNMVTIRIRDTGVGIKKEIIEKVFNPYFSTKENKRIGLGLSTSASIIRDHRGTISIHSEEEKGTEVIIQLPINQVEP